MNATDLLLIEVWHIEDNLNFTIDLDGIITSTNTLDSGIYILQISVENPYSNTLTVSFTLIVEAVIPWELLLVLLMSAAVLTLVVVFIMYRRRTNTRT